MISITQGCQVPGLTILQKIDDPLRLCTIYSRENGDLVLGFGGTRKSWLDWLMNLEPSIEARSLIGAIENWYKIYCPRSIELYGHSQGGAIATHVACSMRSWPCGVSVVTYGGLPTSVDPNCRVTNYLNRSDPMAWVPWWIFGLERFGTVVKIGRPGFSFKAHDPKTYLEEMEKQGYKK